MTNDHEPSQDDSDLTRLLTDRIKAAERGDVSPKSIADIKRDVKNA